MRTTKQNRTGTSHQLALKAKHKLTDVQFGQMLEMLEELTAAERRTLKDPDFITEDEADLIVCDRRVKEPGRISLDDFLAEEGIVPRHSRRA
jgi:hypothetical protein